MPTCHKRSPQQFAQLTPMPVAPPPSVLSGKPQQQQMQLVWNQLGSWPPVNIYDGCGEWEADPDAGELPVA